MVTYSKNQITAKQGINFIKRIVNANGSKIIFIEQENDIGIDMIIEVYEEARPTGRLIAVQVKSGDSFFKNNKTICEFTIQKHREYWSEYNIPVIGIVYIPILGRSYYIDLKKFLTMNPHDKTVKIPINEKNLFNMESFHKKIVSPKLELNSFINDYIIISEKDNNNFKSFFDSFKIRTSDVINNIFLSKNFNELIQKLKLKEIDQEELVLLNKSKGIVFYDSFNPYCSYTYSLDNPYFKMHDKNNFFDEKFIEIKQYLIENA